MATPKRKLPDHVYPQLELAETHAARIARLMQDVERTMTDKRGVNVHLLEKLHARIGESVALITMALALIERQEPMPEHAANGAVDRAWLLAMDKLAAQSGNGTVETIRAFIEAKLKELE